MSAAHKLAEDLEGAQRVAATLPGNLVVAAGAGSGKTTVLAARYVRLLAEGRMPSGERVHARNILVLTFTRKAAAEMYSRIYGALAAAARASGHVDTLPSGSGEAAASSDDPGLAEHLASCLADFSQAQISTFDSFAARVTRSGCSRFGIAPDFAVDEERAARMASDLALSFILEHRENAAMRELISSAGLEGVRDEILAALALRRMCISSPPDFSAFHGLQAARLEEMAAAAKEQILAMRAAALDYSRSPTTPTSKAWLDALEADPDDEGADEGGGPFLSFLERFAGLRKPSSNSRDEASIFLSDFVPELKESAARYRDIAATRAAHPGRLPLYRLLDEFRERWDAIRRAEKTLTFRDVAQLACDVLESDANVLDHYRALFRYVMIDEFQDDDELQKRVLFLLASRDDSREASRREPFGKSSEAEPSEASRGQAFNLASEAQYIEASRREPFRLAKDKLFFVGDEKQSIYLFRGADVSVFRRLAGELSTLSEPSPDASDSGLAMGNPIALVRNFRSEPGVIDMINGIFPSVMAPLDPDAEHQDFEARFQPLESRAATPGVEPRLVYLELPRRREEPSDATESRPAAGLRDAAEAEAWEVARIVRDSVERGSLIVADRATGRARRARYEDFAVLLRSTGNQVHFEKYFRLFDVPYGSENACGLFSEAVACDLYYALRLALYPGDRNALAAYLRSPFAGLSDDALVCVLTAPSAVTARAATAVGSTAPPRGLALPPETLALFQARDKACWERGAETILRLSAMADRAPICACLSFLWFETGYRATLLLDPVASAFEEHFELLHSLAVRADASGECLAAFVAELEPLVGKPDKLEIELPRESSRGVRIMTIHKSKGLEFPVVIVPQANNVGQDWGTRDAWYWEEGLGPTFRPPASVSARSRNAFYEHAKDRRAALVAAELKRLLYVALTRAESHLVITGTEPRGEDTRGRSFRSLLAAPLGLFTPPSPLAKAEEGAAPETRPEAAGELDLSPFGTLAALPSGALVGLIPERSDREYIILAAGARRRGEGARKAAGPFSEALSIPVVERPVRPASSSVSAIAARYAQRDAASGRHAAPPRLEPLEVPPGLAAPSDLSPETWGSLVHAVLESRLGSRSRGPGAPALRLSPALEGALESSLGGDSAVEDAKARAERLAGFFLRSELGGRALASTERHVEMKIAIAIRSEAPRGNAPAIGGSRNGNRERPLAGQNELDFGGPADPDGPARRARGSIDLAFTESGRVVVVDYKTDSMIATGEHDLQIAAYKRAAAEIFGLPAEAWVFYLYGGGRAILVDGDGMAPGLEEAPEPPATTAPSFGRPSANGEYLL